LPMSICPTAMSYLRPSSDEERVSPVMPCFEAVSHPHVRGQKRR
jgi:hypothetical protein